MSYYNYQFRTHSMQRVSKKVLGHKQSLLEVWRMVGETSTDADKHIELWLAQEEFAALTYGVPNYYFINDLKTAEGIERATFHAKSITLQNQIKFLSWPKGFKIDDVIAKGCMVAVLDSVERSHIHDDFTRRMKLPRTKYAVDRDETAGYISINYESPYSIGMHCRLSIPFDLLTPIVEAETHEDMLDILSNKLFGSGMNDTELRYQLALTKLCIKTLVYVQACPDKVVEGVPDKRAAGKQRVYGHIVSGIETDAETSNSPHIVGYHFRQLRHEKYYKGEHKNKPQGSRWVFVSPHERGLNAKTVQA